jgi:hypothetical protein
MSAMNKEVEETCDLMTPQVSNINRKQQQAGDMRPLRGRMFYGHMVSINI